MADPRQIIAILRGITTKEVVSVCEALADAGITLIEVPLHSPEALTSIALASSAVGKRATIGAGTVLTPADVSVPLLDAGELLARRCVNVCLGLEPAPVPEN